MPHNTNIAKLRKCNLLQQWNSSEESGQSMEPSHLFRLSMHSLFLTHLN